MRQYKRNRKVMRIMVLGILGVISLFINQFAVAEHFHYFVDIETTYALNQKKQLTELNVSWVYDEKMSALMEAQNPNLKELGEATIRDLQQDHYFIKVQFNGKPVKIGKATNFNLQKFTEAGITALQLDFTLPLLHPLNMSGKNKLTWSFSDDSGTAIMVYYALKNIRLGGELQLRCQSSLTDNKKAGHGDPEQFLALECAL